MAEGSFSYSPFVALFSHAAADTTPVDAALSLARSFAAKVQHAFSLLSNRGFRPEGACRVLKPTCVAAFRPVLRVLRASILQAVADVVCGLVPFTPLATEAAREYSYDLPDRVSCP